MRRAFLSAHGLARLLVIALVLGGCDRLGAKSRGGDRVLPAGADPAQRSGGAGPARVRYVETRIVFGQGWRIVVPLPTRPDTDTGRRQLEDARRRIRETVRLAFVEAQRLERLFDPSRPASRVAQLNRQAGQPRAPLAPWPRGPFNLFHLCVGSSAGLAVRSGGAFDVTAAPVEKLWRWNGEATVPAAAALRKALAHVGHRGVKLDYANLTIRLLKPGMRVDLGRVAVGYAVDQVAWLLRARQQTDFLISVGELHYASGLNRGRVWRIGLADPRRVGRAYVSLPLQGAAATVADHLRFFQVGKKRYHDVIDPRTGRPARGFSTVTVLHGKAANAAALARAAFVLGPRKGPELIESTAGSEAIFVSPTGHVTLTKRLRGRLKPAPPTPLPSFRK